MFLPFGTQGGGGGGSAVSASYVTSVGVNAIAYGVKGNGHFTFFAVAYGYALTQVSVSGGSTTYTGTINLNGASGAGNFFAGYTFTITGFSNSGNNVQIVVTSSTATTLVCSTTTQVNETHAGYAGSNTIDIQPGVGINMLTDSTVGQIVFATSLTRAGGNGGTNVFVPQGTITAINSSTQVIVSNAPTAVMTPAENTCCLVWGDDETTALTNAWNATTACKPGGMLILPGINPQGDGPAVILTQSAQMNLSANNGTGGSRSGYGACGSGINATYIIPTPNFNFATADSNKVCFCDVSDGANFHNFTIFGAGNGNPGTIYGSSLASYIGVQAHSLDNAIFQDMALLAWGGGNVSGLGIGLNVAGGEIVIRRVDCDMFGNVACQAGGEGSLDGQYFDQCTFWDSSLICLLVNAANGGLYNPVITMNCNMGSASMIVSVIGGGIWHDFGSIVGLHASGSGNNTILVGYATTMSGTVSGQAGTAKLIGSEVTTSASSNLIYLDNSTCSLTTVGCNISQEHASSAVCINNSGTFYDGGGNTFAVHSGSILYSGAGKVFGSGSITGAQQTSGNIALTNFGTTPSVGTVSGNTQLEQFTITVGATPTGTPSLTVTFPTPFLVAPICNMVQVGGTNTISTFTPSAVSTTTATFTYNGTLVAADTLIVQMTASLP